MLAIVLVAILLMFPLLILATESPLILAMFPYVVALGFLVHRLDRAMEPLGAGWLVRTGRLDFVQVAVRTGAKWLDGSQRRVVALDLVLHRPGGRVRLDAVLDHSPDQTMNHRETIVSGRWNPNRIIGFAGWLAERADVPVRESPVTE